MIPVPVHAALDTVSAAALIGGPKALGWPAEMRGPLAAAGAFVAAYSLLTRYAEDSRAPLSMDTHLTLDAVQGAAFLGAAVLSRASPAVRWAMAGYGAFSIAASILTPREPDASTRQVPVPNEAVLRSRTMPRIAEVAPGVAYQRLGIVNVAFLGEPGGPWVLVDAGLPGTAGLIRAAAMERFSSRPPEAIILTHGHFDHTGAVEVLARDWGVPVYAHRAEFPYLTGHRCYPDARVEVGGGLMTALSPLFPTAPIDISDLVRQLADHVPGVAGWQVIHTPGHSPGHVALWREADGVLLSGDAVITTRQEKALSVLLQSPELHGPPAYFTPDWIAAEASVRLLAGLEPEVLLSGHGPPLEGPVMRQALAQLAEGFGALAVPHRSADLPMVPS